MPEQVTSPLKLKIQRLSCDHGTDSSTNAALAAKRNLNVEHPACPPNQSILVWSRRDLPPVILQIQWQPCLTEWVSNCCWAGLLDLKELGKLKHHPTSQARKRVLEGCFWQKSKQLIGYRPFWVILFKHQNHRCVSPFIAAFGLRSISSLRAER